MNVRRLPTGQRHRLLGRRAVLLWTVGAAGGYLVGCGGGDGDEESAPSSEQTAAPGTQSETEQAPTATATTTEPASVSVFDAIPTWTQLEASGPSPRRDHSLVASADGSRVYLFGGRDDSGPLGDAWVYEVSADSWAQREAGPSARFGHNAVFDPEGDRMILFGGQAGSDFFNDTWSFDGQTWRQLTIADPPAPRYGAGAAYLAATDGVYISHGFTNNGRFDDTWRLPLQGDAWGDESPASEPRPIRRCLLRMVGDERSGRIFLFGGQTDDDPFLGDLWGFDTVANTWAEIAQAAPPSPRNLYSLVHVDQPAALLFGGRAEEGSLNDLWVLDFLSDSWLQLAPGGEAPSPRSGHDAAWLSGQNRMLLFGGRDDGQNLLADLWQLSFA